DQANFDAISKPALVGGLCAQTADPALINKTNCVLRGVPGDYTRASTEWNWKTTVIDSFGQMFTPLVSVRADVADMNIANQPGVALTFTSRFRFSETDFTLQRTELETVASFGRWTTTIMYGNYAAQPLIGFLDRREGILGTLRFKLDPNWVLLGGAGYDIHAKSFTRTQTGVGYMSDCL